MLTPLRSGQDSHRVGILARHSARQRRSALGARLESALGAPGAASRPRSGHPPPRPGSASTRVALVVASSASPRRVGHLERYQASDAGSDMPPISSVHERRSDGRSRDANALCLAIVDATERCTTAVARTVTRAPIRYVKTDATGRPFRCWCCPETWPCPMCDLVPPCRCGWCREHCRCEVAARVAKPRKAS